MGNPVMYYNRENYTLQVGSYTVPSRSVFTYDWDTGELTLGGSRINRVQGTVGNAAMNTRLDQFHILPVFMIDNSLGKPNAATMTLWDGNQTGVIENPPLDYQFKMKRPAQVFKGSTYMFTLPAEANILVKGTSIVGASYRQRTNITGVIVSAYQRTKITGKFPSGSGAMKIMFYGGDSWWIDTGAGVEGYEMVDDIAMMGGRWV